jgi:hypothetical protein
MAVNEDAVVDFQRFFVKVSYPVFCEETWLTLAGSRPKD